MSHSYNPKKTLPLPPILNPDEFRILFIQTLRGNIDPQVLADHYKVLPEYRKNERMTQLIDNLLKSKEDEQKEREKNNAGKKKRRKRTIRRRKTNKRKRTTGRKRRDKRKRTTKLKKRKRRR